MVGDILSMALGRSRVRPAGFFRLRAQARGETYAADHREFRAFVAARSMKERVQMAASQTKPVYGLLGRKLGHWLLAAHSRDAGRL